MSVIYTSGTTGLPKGVIRDAMTPEQSRDVAGATLRGDGVAPGHAHARHGADVSLGAERPGAVRARPGDRADAHAAVRSRGVPGGWSRTGGSPTPRSSRRCSCGCSSSPTRSARATTSARWSASSTPPRRAPRTSSGASSTGSGRSSASTTAPPRRASSSSATARSGSRMRGPSAKPSPARTSTSSPPTAGCCARGETGEIFIRPPDYWPGFTYLGQDDKRREIERDGYISIGDVGQRRRRRLPLPVRPRARHGHLGRREHLPGRDRGLPAGARRRPRRRGVRHPRRLLRRGAGRPRRRRARRPASPRAPCASTSVPGWRATRCRRWSSSTTDLPREESGKIFKRRIREPYWQAAGRNI